MWRQNTFALLTVLLAGSIALAGGGLMCAVPKFETDAAADKFVDEMRASGPEGLAQALAGYDLLLERMQVAAIDPNGPAPAGDDQASADVRAVIEGRQAFLVLLDRIAGQRGAAQSRLYWYTNLDDAKAAAAESGKPILSLRMLGKLTDEYSCANSRFFRTALYTNKEISDTLRDNFVLHWQSVRPVPRVTIDFGDGRKLQRTITGNSAHYVLDAAGRPLDVLPGLYGPQAFRAWLERSQALARRWDDWGDDPNRERYLAAYHADRLTAITDALRADLAVVAPELVNAGAAAVLKSDAVSVVPPSAVDAAALAPSKGRVERNVLAQLTPRVEQLADQGDDFWRALGALHRDDSRLDEASLRTIAAEHPTALAASKAALTKAAVESPLMRLARTFQADMATDAVRNEYTLHRRIHEWFARGEAGADYDALNERVYAELFLTPSSDPWLGLAPADAYTALENGGLEAPVDPPVQLGDVGL